MWDLFQYDSVTLPPSNRWFHFHAGDAWRRKIIQTQIASSIAIPLKNTPDTAYKDKCSPALFMAKYLAVCVLMFLAPISLYQPPLTPSKKYVEWRTPIDLPDRAVTFEKSSSKGV